MANDRFCGSENVGRTVRVLLVLAIAASLLLVACNSALTPTATPTATPNSIRTEATCIRVIDGDTIEVLLDGRTHKVRYIGIDTPEMDETRPDILALSQEATEVNRDLVGGQVVDLEKDVSETDRYGRLLRYVYVGDTFVNAELVARGYAQAFTYPPDVKYEDLFLQLQEEAQEEGLGLWATR